MSDPGHEPRRASALDLIDPDEWNRDHDAAERARAERRARRESARATRRRPPARDHARSGGLRALVAIGAGRALAGFAGALLLFTVAGLVALWPGGHHGGRQEAFGGPTLAAEVTAARTVRCPGPARQRCRVIDVRVAGARGGSRTASIDLGPLEATPGVGPGDRVRVRASDGPPGSGPSYGFVDVDRRAPMLWLALAFGLLGIVVARWRGLLALAGVALSVLLVVAFVIPAMLDGSPPLLVSLVGSLAVMFVTLALTYGVGAQSLAAATGIGISLLLATLLGSSVAGLAHLDGHTSELQPLLALGQHGLSLQGVVVAGMVIGALGVLTDMAVSQASSVTALRRANPDLGPRALYRGAFAIGRDHLSATIHTLVLAYVGASLPLLLVLEDAHVGLTDALNGQLVAEPVVATLVGSIALICAVPLTTALAAALVARVPAAALSDAHGHAH
jgi:uncharacterized membrane protein